MFRSEGVARLDSYNPQTEMRTVVDTTPQAQPSSLAEPEGIGRIIEQAILGAVAKLSILGVTEARVSEPPVQGVKEKWIALAKEKIGFGPGLQHPNYFEMNHRITSAYAEMYLSNPDVFKWAGMAAFASKEVGDGMHQAEALRESGLPYIPFVPGMDISGTELLQALAQGNMGVYADLYWQHLAYQGGGIKELEKAYNAGELGRVPFEAWQKIDRGRRENNQSLIWEGNKALLEYEQKTVLQQGVYDQNRKLWREMSSAPVSWFQEIESPIPGDGISFNDYKGGGDIGSFDDRWRWISESMLPAWQRLDANRAESTRQVQQFVIK